jgi:hypothetical protein
MTETALVTYLLANRHRIPNKTIINCLALARLNPTPVRRVTVEELITLFQHSKRGGISGLMLELKRCGLVDFESGVCGTPGYLIFRVGPKEEAAREAHPHRR